ncbi:hypothetical protein [Pseudomonas citronellolis]|uniref:hypothetical protein n=1 Tax=Pseudomonas citronellolis TaxID=53408 RepID=UPI00248E5D7D|nr:hypothetical protein [Pseudomonas citronellolis]
MNGSHITTRAVVQVTVEVQLPTTWEPGCSVEQVHKQAAIEATNRLQNALGTDGGMRIRGAVYVTAVSTTDHVSRKGMSDE